MPETPKRYRGAKAPAKVQSIEKHIEKIYKLPSGSVQIRNSNGTNARGDKTIKKLKEGYNN